jgi:hypothetical protein
MPKLYDKIEVIVTCSMHDLEHNESARLMSVSLEGNFIRGIFVDGLSMLKLSTLEKLQHRHYVH